MTRVFAVSLMLCAHTVAFANGGSQSAPLPCATTFEEVSHFQANIEEIDGSFPAATLRGSAPLRIPVTVHVVRRSDGTGGLPDESLIQRQFENANYGHRNLPWVFVWVGNTLYVDDDSLYADIPTFNDFFNMMATYNTPNTIDLYYAPSLFAQMLPPGGAAGVGTPGANPMNFTSRGTANIAAAVGNTAWRNLETHEFGHVLNLWHPFDNQPECSDGSQCTSLGDFLCDTPASPQMTTTNSTPNGIYVGGMAGPCPGDPVYTPDVQNYMEYGWFITQTHFSEEQKQRMINMVMTNYGDLFDPAAPSTFVDCDSNGVDDIDEIWNGAKLDVNQDWVPDNCQTLPRTGDIVVTGMNPGASNKLNFFDGSTYQLRAPYYDTRIWNHQIRLGPDDLLYVPSLTQVRRYEPHTDRMHAIIIDTSYEGNTNSVFVDILFADNGDYLVLDNAQGNIKRYAAATGQISGIFANLAAAAMPSPKYMEIGPDGAICVVGNGANRVARVDATTGAILSPLVSDNPATPQDESGGLVNGTGLLFDDGDLLVSDGGRNCVMRFDAATGQYLNNLVPANSGGLTNPHSLRIGPDGALWVASRNTNSLKRYDRATGAYLGETVNTGLNQPTAFAWIPDLGAPILPGDLNCDGVVSVSDIGPFVQALTDPAGYAANFPDCDILAADLNNDTMVTVSDIGAFVALLIGGS